MEAFSSRTANETWLSAARALYHRGSSAQSRSGATRELLHTVLAIAEPRERWIVARTPALNPAFALAEVVWILTGRSDARFVTHWNPRLSRYVGSSDQLYGAYGKRLRDAGGFDQLKSAYETLRQNPSSRQVVLQIWSVSLDFPGMHGQPRSLDIPCNISSCLKVRNGSLYWLQTLRSNDLFLGVPHNVVQFTMLQEVVAGWLGVNVGEYVQVSDSLHLYDHDSTSLVLDEATVPSCNTDLFRDGFELSAERFGLLASLMEGLISGRDANREAIYATGLGLPAEYANMFAVIAADDCRRRGETSDVERLMSSCSNPAYVQLWERWCQRQCASRSVPNVQIRTGSRQTDTSASM